MIRFDPEGQPAPGRARSFSVRTIRWLAAPVAGLLITSLAVTLAPGSARAATSGTVAVAPATGATTTLARTRLSSKTVVKLKVPGVRPFSAAIQLRSAKINKGYRAKVSIAANGAMTVSLSRVSGGVETPLGTSQRTGVTVGKGKTIRLQGAVAGTNPVRVFVRAWKSGSRTPAWQLAARDYTSSRIKTAGKTRLRVYLSRAASASTRIAFSKASTSATSVAAVKRFTVKTLVSVPSKAAPTPTPAPAPAPAPVAAGKPRAATTGVKAGSRLTRHNGDITVTKDGTVLANLDIHGFVTVRAKNVTISNSIVRGGKSRGITTGLITNYGFAGLKIIDVRVVPEFPSVYFDGIKGNNFTARRVHVSGGVDSVKIHGNNVTIENSLLENTTHYSKDPQQGGGPTHNDNIQTLYGTNLKFIGNTIRGAQNFAILGAATRGNVNLVVQNNWLDGGHCTVKLQILNGYSQTAKVTGNRFGPHRAVSSCAFTAYPKVSLTHGANTFELTGKTVKPLVLVS